MQRNESSKSEGGLFFGRTGAGRLISCLAGIVILALLTLSGVGEDIVRDSDFDGMPDIYEKFFGLNPGINDAGEDPDSDKLSNKSESKLWTDPFVADTDRDGFSDALDSNPVSRAFIEWGNPLFTAGDEYDYAVPAWYTAAWQADGRWDTNAPYAWCVGKAVASNTGCLGMEVDRARLTNDLRMDIGLMSFSNSLLQVDLVDTNFALVADNVVGNLGDNTGTDQLVKVQIPLERYPNASTILLRRRYGEVRIYSSLLYVDKDGDGLDAAQEIQQGTSDLDPYNSPVRDIVVATGVGSALGMVGGLKISTYAGEYTYTWDGLGNGNWGANPSRWIGPGGYPTALDIVVITNNNIITVEANHSAWKLRVDKAATVKIADGMRLDVTTLHLADGTVSALGNGYVASTNTVITAGNYAYKVFLGSVTAPLRGTNAALRKFGTGIVTLTGTNTYGGRTQIDAGILAADSGAGLPAGSLLRFNGGMLQTTGIMNRTIGTATGCVYWAGNGGFSAGSAPLTVNLHGGATLNWGSATAGFNSKTLILQTTTSSNSLELLNSIGLYGNRTVQVNDNTSTTSDIVRLCGTISNGDSKARTLTKTGNGRLEMAATNLYAGDTTVSAGELRISGKINSAVTVKSAGSRLSGAGTVKGFSINNGGMVAPGNDNTGTLNSTGDVSMAKGSVYEWELGAQESDSVVVSGNVALKTKWRLCLKDAGGYSEATNRHMLIHYSGKCSFGSGIVDVSLVAGNSNWNTSGVSIGHDAANKVVYLTGLVVADGDSMPDWWEMLYFGNLAQMDYGDYDGDWLSNGDEYLKGANPTMPDTDGDGMGDYNEVKCAKIFLKDASPAEIDEYVKLPIYTDFEQGTMTGWKVDWGTAQNQEVNRGDYELSVAPSSCVHYALIGSYGSSEVWEHYDLRYDTINPCAEPPTDIHPMRSVAFYVDHGT